MPLQKSSSRRASSARSGNTLTERISPIIMLSIHSCASWSRFRAHLLSNSRLILLWNRILKHLAYNREARSRSVRTHPLWIKYNGEESTQRQLWLGSCPIPTLAWAWNLFRWTMTCQGTSESIKRANPSTQACTWEERNQLMLQIKAASSFQMPCKASVWESATRINPFTTGTQMWGHPFSINKRAGRFSQSSRSLTKRSRSLSSSPLTLTLT